MKCPKCKKEIEHATFSASVDSFGNVLLERGEYDTTDWGDWTNTQYFCPECEENITRAVEVALNGTETNKGRE